MKKVLLGLSISLFLFGCATTDDRALVGDVNTQKQSDKKSKSTNDCHVQPKKTGSRIARKRC